MTRKTYSQMASRLTSEPHSQDGAPCCAELPLSTYQSSIIPGTSIEKTNPSTKLIFKRIEFKLIREKAPEPYPQHINSAEDAVKVIEHLKDNPQEHFVAIYLDGANGISAVHYVTKGILNSSQTHPREVFRGAIMLDCASIILAHNHPSGNLSPSESDIQITNQLIEVGRIIGIPVLDHVIISQEGHISMKIQGYM